MFSPNGKKLEGIGIGLSGWAIVIVAPLLMFCMYVLPYILAGCVVIGWIYLICSWIGDRRRRT